MQGPLGSDYYTEKVITEGLAWAQHQEALIYTLSTAWNHITTPTLNKPRRWARFTNPIALASPQTTLLLGCFSFVAYIQV